MPKIEYKQGCLRCGDRQDFYIDLDGIALCKACWFKAKLVSALEKDPPTEKEKAQEFLRNCYVVLATAILFALVILGFVLYA